MPSYSELVDRLLLPGNDCLQKLIPTESGYSPSVLRIRQASDVELSGGKEITPLFPAVRAGLFYFYDAIMEGHKLVQDLSGDVAAYWHGMIHRREGDFDNARYWFRRAGAMPHFARLYGEASEESALIARQTSWDPYLFTMLCEQHKFGEEDGEKLLELQQIEFRVTFDYTWRQATH